MRIPLKKIFCAIAGATLGAVFLSAAAPAAAGREDFINDHENCLRLAAPDQDSAPAAALKIYERSSIGRTYISELAKADTILCIMRIPRSGIFLEEFNVAAFKGIFKPTEGALVLGHEGHHAWQYSRLGDPAYELRLTTKSWAVYTLANEAAAVAASAWVNFELVQSGQPGIREASATVRPLGYEDYPQMFRSSFESSILAGKPAQEALRLAAFEVWKSYTANPVRREIDFDWALTRAVRDFVEGKPVPAETIDDRDNYTRASGLMPGGVNFTAEAAALSNHELFSGRSEMLAALEEVEAQRHGRHAGPENPFSGVDLKRAEALFSGNQSMLEAMKKAAGISAIKTASLKPGA